VEVIKSKVYGPVANADVWKPDLLRRQHKLIDAFVVGGVPRQEIVMPFLSAIIIAW